MRIVGVKQVVIIILGVFFYFLSYSILGEKGIIKYFALKKQLEGKKIIENSLHGQLQDKQKAVKGMNIKSLDIDLLDEQARKNLGYAGENEIIIYDK